MKFSRLDPDHRVPLLRNHASPGEHALSSNHVHKHPNGPSGKENATIYFIGTATTVIEWDGFRILTDPNFLHAGDHVHLGPGVNATRQTNPAVEMHDLPAVDCVLLSHYHEDHFDREVEASLNRAFPIITTPHAKSCLTSGESKDEPFTSVTSLDNFEHILVAVDPVADSGQTKHRVVKITGTPGKHVPPGPLAAVNDFLQAVPPTNGWIVELGYTHSAQATQDPGENDDFQVGYRVYISGDTLFVDELLDIPKYLASDKIDLMLVHLGGTTIPGPSMPLLMVTMDAKQGLQLMQLMNPDVTIPIHFDDYDVFMSPLSDFKKEVDAAELQKRVVYLDRGESYNFTVGEGM